MVRTLGNSKRLVSRLLVLAIVIAAVVLAVALSENTEPPREISIEEEPHKEITELTLARTLREGKTGAEQPAITTAPKPRPAAPPSSRTNPTPPMGYAFVKHQGTMLRAPHTPPTSPEISPNPTWLNPIIGFDELRRQAKNAGRDWTFAAVRLSPGIQRQSFEASLNRTGAKLEGYSGEYARIRTAITQHSLETVVDIPGVLGLGAMPKELKVHRDFAEESLSKPSDEQVPVYVTLMTDDSTGEWRDALTRLGMAVGAYDSALRSYTANMPYGAIEMVAEADFVMAIDPIAVVQALNDSAVTFMGGDAMRTYQYATGTFTGLTGEGIAIGVMDTGLNTRHLDISSGRDSLCGANFYPGEDFDLWIDQNGHGTHVTGTLAGAGKDKPRYAGMAPHVSDIRFAKVLNFRGFGSDSDIRRGMDYLARPTGCIRDGPNSPQVKPLIVNMSLAQVSISSSGRGVGERKLDSIVHKDSQLYVVAQANAATQGFSNYGTAKNSLAIGAVNDAGEIATFSSRGPTADERLAPNLVGAGVSVTSPLGEARRTGYTTRHGTSMAAPAVAGLAALLMETENAFQNHPALTRARLMASAVRPDAFLMSQSSFPRDNTDGPGSLQNAYGLGLASTRTSVLTRDQDEGWTSGSATSTPSNGSYEYVDIVVPNGANRLDIVMTWDEQPADTLTRSVLNNLDLWVDHGADCTANACGEYSSLSNRDNVEWLFINDPTPGTYRIKILPTRLYGEAVDAAIAWTIIRGNSTPLLNLKVDQESITISDGDDIEVDVTLSTSHYVASGTTLHMSCRQRTDSACGGLEEAYDPESSQVFREDGLARPLADWAEIDTSISLGEIGVGDGRRLQLKFAPPRFNARTRLYFTATAWNARSTTAYVDLVSSGNTSEAAPALASPINDQFENASVLAGSSGSSHLDLLLASREPGESRVRSGSRTLWYAWTAPNEGLYRFRLSEAESGDAYEAEIDIYTGNELVSLKGHTQKTGSELSFTADQGVTYKLRIKSSEWTVNPLVLEWEPADVRPANDDFSFAQPVSDAEAQVTGSNEGATLERGEYWGGLASTVWYHWTAPADGYWNISVDDSQLNVAVFQGANLSSLRLVSGPDPTDSASIQVQETQVYRVAVAAAGADASGAQFTLSFSELADAEPFEPYDQFDTAKPLEGDAGSEDIDADFSGYTVQPGEPPETGIGTVWWNWSAPETARYTWSIEGSNAFRLTLFTGADLGTLSLVASTTGGSSGVLDATAGTTYQIGLGRTQDAMNNGGFGQPTSIEWGKTPINDDRPNAAQLTGTSGTTSIDLEHATVETSEPTDNVGYESLWWRWSAPASGWYRFWLGDDPTSLILSIYPQGQGSSASNEPVASSDSLWPVNGRVETWVHARSGDQYNIRVARRPLVERQNTTMLRWESISAPPLLGYKSTVTNQTLASTASEGGLSNPQNLVTNDDGTQVFSTSDGRLLGFTRDSTTGGLTLAQRLDSESSADSGIDFTSLAGAHMRWDATNDRLLAHAGTHIYDLELSEGESSLNYSSTLAVTDGSIPKTPTKIVADLEGFLLFALYRDPELIQVFRVSATDADTLTLIQTVKATDATGDNELLAEDIADAQDMEISSDDSHLYLSATAGLVVLAINETTDLLSHVRTISTTDQQGAGAFQGFSGVRNLVLDASGSFLFVTGHFAPEIAVFDVSGDPALPVLLDAVTEFHYQSSFELLFFTPYHTYPDFFSACHYAERHGSLPAIDVICAYGFYTAWWDSSKNELAVIDYANSGAEDRFGTQVPEFLVGRRQLAQSPNGAHLYLATGGATLSVPDPHAIHVFERASARTLDESGNHAPTINKALADQTARVGSGFSYQFPADTFSDADSDPLTYTASSLPNWLRFNASTRTFSGTPQSEHVTISPMIVRVTASDTAGTSVSTQFALRVEQPESAQNAAPLQNQTIPDQTATVGQAFSFVFSESTFRDPDGDALTYSASGMPDWLSFDSATRTFSGTPGADDLLEAARLITITASDDHGASARASFYLSLRAASTSAASISISSAATELNEWDDTSPVTVRIQLDLPVDVAQIVQLTSTGTATLGSDFELESTQVTIDAGTRAATTRLTPIRDFDGEGDETITLEIGTIEGGVSASDDSSVSLSLKDQGALFADAKSNLYGDLYVFFSDRVIRQTSIEFQVLVYNLGARRTSGTTMQFWVSDMPSFTTSIGGRVRATIPAIDPGRGVEVTITVDLDDFTSAGTYYAVAGVASVAEELPGRAYTNEDLTGFALDSNMRVITTCPDLARNSSPGTTDPLKSAQWNLDNTGQTAFAAAGGVAGEDLDMTGAITDGVAGADVKIAVVDTGLEICHPDLDGNVESGKSHNFNSSDWSGSSTTDPSFSHTLGDHGTSVAGIIAAEIDNGIGGRGVAPSAKIRGYNYLEANEIGSPFLDSLGGSTSNPDSSDVDIFNMSFGSFGAESNSSADHVTLFKNGVTNLRSGRGAIYVKAAGNSFTRCSSMKRLDEDSDFDLNDEIGCVASNADATSNLPYILAIAAFNADGKRASYSSAGSSVWVTAPAGEFGNDKPAMITTDQMGSDKGYDALIFGVAERTRGLMPGATGNPLGDYVSTFNGTSASVPNTSGAIALLLGKHPMLTWRDIKYILAKSARKIDPDIPEFKVAFGGKPAVLRHAWSTNAAGYHFHNWYGFGAISVDDALALAETHTPNSLGTFADGSLFSKTEEANIPDNDGAGVSQSLSVSGLADTAKVEAAELSIRVTHPFTNDLGIYLISPSGTESILHPVFSETLVGNANLNWKLLSNAFYGESPNGDWTLKVIDAASGDTGTLDSWSLTLWTGEIPAKE